MDKKPSMEERIKHGNACANFIYLSENGHEKIFGKNIVFLFLGMIVLAVAIPLAIKTFVFLFPKVELDISAIFSTLPFIYLGGIMFLVLLYVTGTAIHNAIRHGQSREWYSLEKEEREQAKVDVLENDGYMAEYDDDSSYGEFSELEDEPITQIESYNAPALQMKNEEEEKTKEEEEKEEEDDDDDQMIEITLEDWYRFYPDGNITEGGGKYEGL